MEEPYFFINSAVRTLEILGYLSKKSEASVTDVSNFLDVSRSTAHRFLASMKYVGFLNQNSDNQKYSLSLKIFEIGSSVVERLNIREVAKPIMQKLSQKTGETVNLGILHGGEVVYIDKELSKNNLRMDCPIGGRDPASCTALGKAMLAFRKIRYIEEYVRNYNLVEKTPNTITDIGSFFDELKNVKVQGYAVDKEETAIGLMCIAAPIFNNNNEANTAISISVPTIRLCERDFDIYLQELLNASKLISKKWVLI